MMELRRYFDVLEIPVSASYEEARAAYRDMVSVWHPDKFAQNSRLQIKATEKLKQINIAWHHVESHYRSARNSSLTSEGPESSISGRDQAGNYISYMKCSRCLVLNSIPEGMPLQQARCGQCGTHLCRSLDEKGRVDSIRTYLAYALQNRPAGEDSPTIMQLATGFSIGIIVMLLLFLIKYSF